MESKTLKVAKLISDFERKNPKSTDIPQKLKKQFRAAWADDKLNGRETVDYMWKGEPYYSDVKDAKTARTAIKSRNQKSLETAARRSGNTISVDDYINHPRYKGDPKLATVMYEYDLAQLKRQFRFNSKTNHLDHIVPVSKGGIEHWRNKMLAGAGDNIRKGNKLPSQKALNYLGIATTTAEMVDMAASSPWPRQTPRNKRTILQGDLGMDYKKGMGPAYTNEFSNWKEHTDGRIADTVRGISPRARIKALGIASMAPGFLGTAADAAETTARVDLARKSGNPVDWLQAGISGATTALGATGVGEVAGLPLELLNGSIDQHREGLPQIRGRSGAARASK